MEVDKVEYTPLRAHTHTHTSNNDYALLPNIKLTFISYNIIKALNVPSEHRKSKFTIKFRIIHLVL